MLASVHDAIEPDRIKFERPLTSLSPVRTVPSHDDGRTARYSCFAGSRHRPSISAGLLMDTEFPKDSNRR